ncbi:MAG: hypothetical protein JW776_12205 [Candidatus Lokiarchaeota archaeon]|nr:hypothetical protein [Candidatus Lokiarchaeota archaeon]
MANHPQKVIIILVSLLAISGFLIPPIFNFPSFRYYTKAVHYQNSLEAKKYISNSQMDYNYPYNGSELSNYSFTLTLQELSHSLDGIMDIDYFNNDSVSFDALPFRLMVPSMSYSIRQGDIQIHAIYKDGDPSTPLNFQLYKEENYMWVTLSEPLLPKSRTQFQIIFTTIFPDGGIDRCNEYAIPEDPQSHIFKWAWGYPMPSVYDEYDGWNLDPYNVPGDPFYSDMAWYKMSVEVPSDMVIAANGNLTFTEYLANTTRRYYDPLLPVREVTFSASRYFEEWKYIRNNQEIGLYFLNSSTHWEDIWASSVKDMIDLYEEKFGEYVYPILNIVEEHTSYGGMEHSCQVYISSKTRYYNTPNDYFVTETIISHELAHQWYFGMIGVDQIDAGHVDEGLACWVDAYYHEWKYPFGDPDFPFENIRTYEDRTGLNHRINLSVYELNSYNTDYWYVAYTKAPVIYEKLRRTIGTEIFFEGLRILYQRHIWDFIWLDDVQDAFEIVTGQDLDWFFLPWFDNKNLPQYNIISATYDSTNQRVYISIEDMRDSLHLYSYNQKIPVEILDPSGEIIHEEWVWINGSSQVSVQLPEDVIPRRVNILNIDSVLAYKQESANEVLDTYRITRNQISGFYILPLSIFAILGVGYLGIKLKTRNSDK